MVYSSVFVAAIPPRVVHCAMQRGMDVEPICPEYLATVRRMSGAERLYRMTELSEAIWQMLALKIAARHPELTEREVCCRVAEKVYQSDPHALALLAKSRR